MIAVKIHFVSFRTQNPIATINRVRSISSLVLPLSDGVSKEQRGLLFLINAAFLLQHKTKTYKNEISSYSSLLLPVVDVG
jgi:hypothetical protein